MNELKTGLEILKYVFFLGCCIGVLYFTVRAFGFGTDYLFGDLGSIPLITIERTE